MSTKIHTSHEKSDGVSFIAVYSDDFQEPLFGDYRGVELCRIIYIPSREDSAQRAEQIASTVAAALERKPKRAVLIAAACVLYVAICLAVWLWP